MNNGKRLNIAIDGPAGAGKSTVAKAIAKELGIRYLDTGAMYRAMALFAKRCGVDVADGEGVVRILPEADIRVRYSEDGAQHTMIGDEDVTDQLRTMELGMGASMVGLYPPVRIRLAELQRRVGQEYDVVMDGREITTFVLPDTPYKFYVTADPSVRAKRRMGELMTKCGTEQTLEEIEREIIARDENDMGRAFMPLRIAEDAMVIDTSDLSVQQVLETMLNAIREREER